MNNSTGGANSATNFDEEAEAGSIADTTHVEATAAVLESQYNQQPTIADEWLRGGDSGCVECVRKKVVYIDNRRGK